MTLIYHHRLYMVHVPVVLFPVVGLGAIDLLSAT